LSLSSETWASFTTGPRDGSKSWLCANFTRFQNKRLLGFGVALCRFFGIDNKGLLGFGMALCKFYNPLILNNFLALARAKNLRIC
jgi:hypothetical protein